MKREHALSMHGHERHDIRNASVVSGALIGATTGILGGIAGIGVAGILGAVMGALGGFVLEHELERSEALEGDDAIGTAEAAALIEPACPDCLGVRAGSAGTVMWCARHTKHHPAAHLHYTQPRRLGMGSMIMGAST